MAGEQAHLFALFGGEDDLSVGELDEGAPLADFDVEKQVTGLVEGIGAAEQTNGDNEF